MIYLIETGAYFKVGYASNIDKRMKSYKTHNPNFTVVKCFDGDRDLEKFLHSKLKKYRHVGEWFLKFDNYSDIVSEYTAVAFELNKPKEIKVRTTVFSVSELDYNYLNQTNLPKLVSNGKRCTFTIGDLLKCVDIDSPKAKDFLNRMVSGGIFVRTNCIHGELYSINFFHFKKQLASKEISKFNFKIDKKLNIVEEPKKIRWSQQEEY